MVSFSEPMFLRNRILVIFVLQQSQSLGSLEIVQVFKVALFD